MNIKLSEKKCNDQLIWKEKKNKVCNHRKVSLLCSYGDERSEEMK